MQYTVSIISTGNVELSCIVFFLHTVNMATLNDGSQSSTVPKTTEEAPPDPKRLIISGPIEEEEIDYSSPYGIYCQRKLHIRSNFENNIPAMYTPPSFYKPGPGGICMGPERMTPQIPMFQRRSSECDPLYRQTEDDIFSLQSP